MQRVGDCVGRNKARGDEDGKVMCFHGYPVVVKAASVIRRDTEYILNNCI